VKLLLDTHVVIWALGEPALIPAHVGDLVTDPANEVLVSAVSGYEIEFKRPRSAELSRLPADLRSAVETVGFFWLPITEVHAITAGRLPRLHGDPFDRLLAAQGLTEAASVVTVDPLIAPYGVPTIW